MGYEKVKEGEWIRPKKNGYKFSCCDCGLVHTANFRVRKGRAEVQVFRHNRATATYRRRNGITVKFKYEGEK
jgi:Zn-finger protein